MPAIEYPDINARADGDCGYVANYGGRKVGVYAPSLYAASEIARDYFNPPKSKRHMVSVLLAEDRDGNVVPVNPAIF